MTGNGNPFVHMELTTQDRERSKKFYGEMFGWQFTDNPMPDPLVSVYTTFKPSDGPGGGMLTIPGAPPMWIPYIGVHEIHEATAKAKSLGADVIREAAEVPNQGWFSVLKDPTGAMVALWQQKQN